MQLIRSVLLDGTVKDIPVRELEGSLIISKNSLPDNIKYLDVLSDCFTANAGDEGFMLIPSIEGSHYSALTFFHPRENCEEIFPDSSMPIYACQCGGHTILAIVTGMRFDYSLVMGVRDGKYYLYPRFLLNGTRAYEDIEIQFLHLYGDIRYPELAKAYRNFQLKNGNCRTLREKAAERPVLKEFADTIECRIRLAWKPVPSTLDDQIISINEPDVHAELTFKDVYDIISEFHQHGINKVNFCLVGWNAGGHDGRFPDIFPVEPKCGTLAELEELVARAKDMGYLITAHTNLFEGYSVAKRFNHDYVLKQPDGSDHRGGNWGGGKSYLLCPKMAFEHYLNQDIADLRQIGFRGEHYFDVFSICPPYSCSHPEHPMNRKEIAEWRCRIMKKTQDMIGCVGSEGSWDFAADVIDYVLYMVYFINEESVHPMCDEYIPFWNLAYHGITLYNCCAATVNANIKNDRMLNVINYAWGGRPLNYVNSKFIVGANPWGNEDLRYFPVKQFRKDVAKIRKDYDFYQSIKDLQYEFIDDYEVLPNGGLKTVYSNGAVMLSNPTENEITAEGHTLIPFSNSVFR